MFLRASRVKICLFPFCVPRCTKNVCSDLPVSYATTRTRHAVQMEAVCTAPESQTPQAPGEELLRTQSRECGGGSSDGHKYASCSELFTCPSWRHGRRLAAAVEQQVALSEVSRALPWGGSILNPSFDGRYRPPLPLPVPARQLTAMWKRKWNREACKKIGGQLL